MEVADYIGYADTEGDKFASAAEQGDLDVDVPACEGWDMRALVRHLGLIHLWAAAHLAFPGDDRLDAKDIPAMAHYWPELGSSWPEDEDLVSWYRQTKENLVDVLKSTPADHECFTFLPAPTPLTMWSRRQASEIAVHRFDAEQARGISSGFEPEFATDMLDELLSGFAPRPKFEDGQVESDQVLHVHADDVDEHWYLTIGPDGIKSTRDGGEADLTITATASQLYLLMWNRTDDSTATLTGDAGVMDLWRETSRVRWSGGE
ncbi:MAG: maleylpyruvate isomerase family mycothiol-dependent enzyme [Acidimicrobiales bacterium]|nr:maleylpyruvate isomerase family mycothiol-dependent enzyme [Acidimicrobiales bacterium]RZV45198.1 MAG: maleylpyruvate isomerase family mycothiol-dependent enzyme [Acidimicrobiales bacterium]